MSNANQSYRIRVSANDVNENVVHVDMNQTYESYDILSLKINQTNSYRLMESDNGLIVGRVLANGGFGIPNAKISLFIPTDGSMNWKEQLYYGYHTTYSTNQDKIRYNLLPNQLDDKCHQTVGTFPDKCELLDDNTWIETFDKYYKYTTKTNNAGDYMLYGVPTGIQNIHVDIDLSDVGVLSQRPRDMVAKGFNINQFESPNKFRTSTNLNSLPQIITQNKSIFVYPFWGDTTTNEKGAAITRCDIDIDYKFESSCVFIGSVITDTGENALSKKCQGAKKQGKMSDMVTGQGTIEMIRKTPTNQIEQFSINGNQLIDGDGVWCYSIPMNLDYVVTDEYGNTVMTDNPNKGIATRSRVRFRVGMSDNESDGTARKRARYLIPNNPRLIEEDYPEFYADKEHKVDFEFGSKTKDENFRDLLWNKVYTVKNYIPRLQKPQRANTKKFLGIKMVNHPGGNNPMPFNSLAIKFNFMYSFICLLLKLWVRFVSMINGILNSISKAFFRLFEKCMYWSGKNFLGLGSLFGELNDLGQNEWNREEYAKCAYLEWIAIPRPRIPEGLGKYFLNVCFAIGCGIKISGLCDNDDEQETIEYSPGMTVINDINKLLHYTNCYHTDDDDVCTVNFTDKQNQFCKEGFPCETNLNELFNCIENQLAQDNEVTSFDFSNDWVNGTLYFPLWYRKIRPKKKIFGFNRKAKDQWCTADDRYNGRDLKVYRVCSPEMKFESKNKYKLAPLGKSNTYVDEEVNNDFGLDTIKFYVEEESNCYGFKCHTKSKTWTPINRGVIKKKNTMYGDEVYYYTPLVYDIESGNKDLVFLFATDIILLGSLNDCDIQGIPQFFRGLDGTTYNMPPDLLDEDYVYSTNGIQSRGEEVDSIEDKMTVASGADWGNRGDDQPTSDSRDRSSNIYDNGGLFYGIGCFDSYTKPKSCINLSRICEFGVSLDVSQDILNVKDITKNMTQEEIERQYTQLIADGYISYDDIHDKDYRSMFATMNSNNLKTYVNVNNGLREYVLTHMYIDNFDGLMRNLMEETTSSKASYYTNYLLEESCEDYMKFRFGDYEKQTYNDENNNDNNDENKYANKYLYHYEYDKVVGISPIIYSKYRFPRYENSFYFYFGLKEGKTAIDKFRLNYFSECTNDSQASDVYNMDMKPHSWCGDESGYLVFDCNFSKPINIRFIDIDNSENVYFANNIQSNKFYISKYKPENINNDSRYEKVILTSEINSNTSYEYLPTGVYDIIISDGDENVYEDRIIYEDVRLDCKVQPTAFLYSEGELESQFLVTSDYEIDWKTTFTNIAEQSVNIECVGSIGRDNNSDCMKHNILGLIELSFKMEDGNSYRIEVKPSNPIFFGTTHIIKNDDGSRHIVSCDGNNIYIKINETDIEKIGTIKNDVFKAEQGNDYEGYEYMEENNYVGCELRYVWNETTKKHVCYKEGVGYHYYDNLWKKHYIGVPYPQQKYNVIVTQLCNDRDTDNQFKQEVFVSRRIFNMYINGIDYDIIRNFKTGWVDKTIDEMNSSTFKSSNIYGWNDVYNIGKVNISSDIQNPNYKVLYDLDEMINDYCNNTSKNISNFIISVGDVLSSEYDGNGFKKYVRPEEGIAVDNDDNDSTMNGDSSLTPISNTKSTNPTLIIFEISTPYTWKDEYCYYDEEWQLDREFLSNKNITVENNSYSINSDTDSDTDKLKNIMDKIDDIIFRRIEFVKELIGAFRDEMGEKEINITYKSSATPIDYCILGSKEDMLPTRYGSNSVYSIGQFQKLNDNKSIHRQISIYPTLTNNGNYINYEKENIGNTKVSKYPYYVAIRDNNNITLPNVKEYDSETKNGNTISVVKDIFMCNDDCNFINTKNLFGIHIYDKPLNFELVKYIVGADNIPLLSLNNVKVNLNDMVAGYVWNGIENVSLNIDDIEINAEIDENSNTSIRLIGEDKYENTRIKRYIYIKQGNYGKYQLNDNFADDSYQYIELLNNSTHNLIVSDGYGNDYEDTLRDNFNISIANTHFTYSIENNVCVDSLKLNVSGGVLSTEVTHYVYQYVDKYYELGKDDNGNTVYKEKNDSNYPYEHLIQNTDGTWTFGDVDIEELFTIENSSPITGITDDKFNSYFSSKYKVNPTDSGDNVEPTNSGDNEHSVLIGKFTGNTWSLDDANTDNMDYWNHGKHHKRNNNDTRTLQKILNDNDSKFFVLSVFGKYRQLSPVIDYSRFKCYINWKNDDENINNNVMYLTSTAYNDFTKNHYLNKYSFDLVLPVYNDDGTYIDNYRQTISNVDDNIVSITVTDGTETEVVKALEIIFNDFVLEDWMVFDIIDCTGIRKRVKTITNLKITDETNNTNGTN